MDTRAQWWVIRRTITETFIVDDLDDDQLEHFLDDEFGDEGLAGYDVDDEAEVEPATIGEKARQRARKAQGD